MHNWLFIFGAGLIVIAPLLLLLTEESCSRYAKLVVYLVIFLRGGFISIAVIPILGSIVGFIISNIIALLDGAGTILMALLIRSAKKYLVPCLKVEKRRRYVEYIAAIADEVANELICAYPDNIWIKKIDEAVNKIISICAINSEIARRAVSARK